MSEVVLGLIVRDGLVLLGLRSPNRHARPGCWDLIGGHVEPGEGLKDALVRELAEELGVRPLVFHAITTLDAASEAGAPASFHIFRIDAFLGEPRLANDEHTELRWFSSDEACALRNLASPLYLDIFRRLGASATAT